MGFQNFFATRLATEAGASDTVITVENVPTATTGKLVLEARNPTQREIITYTGISGNQLTGVSRGYGGTTAKPHARNALVEMNLTAEDLQEIYDLFGTGNVEINGAKLKPESVTSDKIDPTTQNTDPDGAFYDTGWVSPAFASGYTSSSLVLRKIGSRVYVRGYISRNSGNIPTSATTVATLPTGFKPKEFELFMIQSGSEFRVTSSNGDIQVAAATARTSLYASGVSWSTD